MTNLKEARKKGKIDKFIKKHEADPDGDLDKLDAMLCETRPRRPQGRR